MASHSTRPYLVALGLLWGAPVLLVLLLHLTLPDHNATGGCSGIGFGCSLPPSEAVVLLGMLAAAPLVLLGMVVCIVIAVVQSGRTRRDASPALRERHDVEGVDPQGGEHPGRGGDAGEERDRDGREQGRPGGRPGAQRQA